MKLGQRVPYYRNRLNIRPEVDVLPVKNIDWNGLASR